MRLRKMDTLPLMIFGMVMTAGVLFGLVVLLIRITMIRGQRNAEARCPNCLMRDIRPSFQKGFQDTVFRLFSCMPYRCRACETRFYRYRDTGKADAGDPA